MVWGVGLRVEDLGFRVECLGFRFILPREYHAVHGNQMEKKGTMT